MRKTQIYLNDTEYDRLREEAYQRHKTMSSVIRDILVRYWHKPTKERSKKATLLKLIGLGRCGAKDVSVRHDEYLAGLE